MGFDWIPYKNYKRHYICLNCQKGFKRPSKKDMKHSVSVDLSNLMDEYYSSEVEQDILEYINAAHQKRRVVCPNCEHQLLQVHYNFEVPPRRDNKSWKALKERMSFKLLPQYNTYVHWHLSALQKTIGNLAQSKKLEQNLAKLEFYINRKDV